MILLLPLNPNLPPLKRTLHSFVSLKKARWSTPHFRRGGGRNGWRPAIRSFRKQAGSDGRLAGHFTKLAELQRPARTWEDGQTPVENGGGDWGDLFLVGSLKKVGGNDMFKVGCRLGFPHPVLSLKKLTEC